MCSRPCSLKLILNLDMSLRKSSFKNLALSDRPVIMDATRNGSGALVVRISASMFGFAFAVSALTGLPFSTAPALRTSRKSRSAL